MITAIIPGTYVDVIAGEREDGLGVEGVVTMPLTLDWGDTVITLLQGEDPYAKFGYRLSDVKMKLIREVMNYANELIVYRLNVGTKATATLASGITAQAAFGGARGNDLSVVVKETGEHFTVETYLDKVKVDTQIIDSVDGFVKNGFLEITGSGTLAEITVNLTNGANGTVEEDAIEDYFIEMEKHEFNVITSTNPSYNDKIIAFVDEQRNNGRWIQAVLNGAAADNKAVINSTIGGKTAWYELTAAEACATMAGIQAKCGIRNSATYYNVIGWTDTVPRLTRLEQETRTQAGQILFVYKYGQVMVLYDINSLVTYTEENPKDFSKNLVIRTLDQYASDLQALLDKRVIGKIRNSVSGRNQIKGMVAEMTMRDYLDNGYIEGFTADDITVEIGSDRDAVTVTVGLQVADTVDKIYVTVTSL